MNRQTKKQMLKNLKANQIIMITQKELDELKAKSSFFDKFTKEKNFIIDGITQCKCANEVYEFISKFFSV